MSSTIASFCKRHNFSRGTYYVMRSRGEGPDELRAGPRVVRITHEAEAQWIEERTFVPSPTNQPNKRNDQ